MKAAIGLAAALAAALLLADGPARAQEPEPEPEQNTGQQQERTEEPSRGLTFGQRPSVEPAEAWTDDELVALARALGDMGSVMREGRVELANADGAAERREVQEEIFVGMLLAIENAGLTVERYNALIAAMNEDPEMRERVATLLPPSGDIFLPEQEPHGQDAAQPDADAESAAEPEQDAGAPAEEAETRP